MSDSRDLLLASFHAALAAADPLAVVPRHLPPPPAGRTLVVGAGKAAAAMAVAVETCWPMHAPLDGIVLTRYRHSLLTTRIQVLEAGHPIPDQSGLDAAREVLNRTRTLGANDLLLVLVSGGGSSLLTLPADGVSLEGLQMVTRELLRCGAPIQDINTVRKHLSDILGGKLAAACKAPVNALIISDVTGDDPTHVASGPCAPDPSTFDDALRIVDAYGIRAPGDILARLRLGASGGVVETPKPSDAVFDRVSNTVIATAQASLQAAAAYFEERGIGVAVLGDAITGEAREVAKAHAAIARQVAVHGRPWQRPVALISGGECTVTVTGKGRGGRCSEYMLSLGSELAGLPGVWALACDTDGIDGTEDNAGAVLSPQTLARGRDLGLDPRTALAENDSWNFFAQTGDLVVTGPTRTNVNDYRVILIQ